MNQDYRSSTTFTAPKSLKNLVTLDSSGSRLQPRIPTHLLPGVSLPLPFK